MERKISRRQFLELSAGFAGDRLAGLSRRLSETATFESYLEGIVENPPEIGGYKRYEKPLRSGIGFATRYIPAIKTILKRGRDLRELMKDNNLGYLDLNPGQKRIYDLTRRGRESVEQSLTEKQSSPIEALKSNKISGFIAPRSPNNLFDRFLVYGVEKNQEEKINFLGTALAIDCAARHDWNRRLANWRYTEMGWDLQWIADVSDSLMKRLPPGLNPDRNDISQGRPGMILVSEENFHRFRFPQALVR
jgi:hypothetical protein